MSGSPKYTNVVLAAQRRAQMEAARREREEERRRQAEEARQRRIAAGIQDARARTDQAAARLAELAVTAAGLPQQSDVVAAQTALRAAAADLSAHPDEAGLKRTGRSLRDAERSADRLGVMVAQELTSREHGAALDVVIAPLGQVADRAVYDPEGSRTVDTLTSEARRSAGGPQFPAAHQRLSTAITEHLDTARTRLARSRQLAADAEDVAGRLASALADADANAVELPDRTQLENGLEELRSSGDGLPASRREHRIGELRKAAEEVSATVDARLDQAERMAIVVEAASAALPKAGLTVVPGSLVEGHDSVSFTASRSDGVPIELTVHAGDGRGSRLEYRVDGGDVVVEQTGDGQVSRCDLTEDLLESFHVALDGEGIATDGLHWEGKPDGERPDRNAAVDARARETRERSR